MSKSGGGKRAEEDKPKGVDMAPSLWLEQIVRENQKYYGRLPAGLSNGHWAVFHFSFSCCCFNSSQWTWPQSLRCVEGPPRIQREQRVGRQLATDPSGRRAGRGNATGGGRSGPDRAGSAQIGRAAMAAEHVIAIMRIINNPCRPTTGTGEGRAKKGGRQLGRRPKSPKEAGKKRI